MKAGKGPRPGVKKKILEKTQSAQKGKVVKLGAVSVWKYATAASVVLALSIGIFALKIHNIYKKTEASMEIMSNPSFARIIMKGTENSPEALASVYWNQSSQEVYLSIQNLKTLTPEQQYQLWAIVDGKPVDMGVFDSGHPIGLIKMRNVGKAAAFAVTIEPRGGKSSPTLETMQVLGNT